MKLHFLLVGTVAIGLVTLATDSDAHGGGGGGGGHGGGGGGRGGGMFHGGGGARGGVAMFRGGGAVFHGGWHSGGLRGRGRFLIMVVFLARVSAFMAMDTRRGTIGTMGTIPTRTTETMSTFPTGTMSITAVRPTGFRTLKFCPPGQSKRHSRGAATTGAG